MIPKKSTEEILNLIEEADASIKQTAKDIQEQQQELNSLAELTASMREFSVRQTSQLANSVVTEANFTRLLPTPDNTVAGTYEKTGACVQAKPLREVRNLLNFNGVSGCVYKETAKAYMNEVENAAPIACLKHDSISSKNVWYQRFTSPSVRLTIELPVGGLIGDVRANMLDLAPLFPGGARINEIMVWTVQDQKTGAISPSFRKAYTNTLRTGRIAFDKDYDVWKVTIAFQLLHQDQEGLYPFGLQHLYLLYASLQSKCSILLKLCKQDYIDTIEDRLVLHGGGESIETTASELGAKFFGELKEEGVPYYELTPSLENQPEPIARNLKTIYIRVPLTSFPLEAIDVWTTKR